MWVGECGGAGGQRLGFYFLPPGDRGMLAPKTEKTPVRGSPTLRPTLIRRQKMPTFVPDLGIHHSVPPRLLTGIWAAVTRRQAAPGGQVWREPGLDGPRVLREESAEELWRRQPGCEEQFAFPIKRHWDTLVSDSVFETLESFVGFPG